MTTTLEAPAEEPQVTQRIERVEGLPEEVRQHIIAERNQGATLAELKSGFNVAPDVIREVLPPANKREATQRKAKEAKDKVTESTQGIGGRSGEAKSDPKPKKEEAPKAVPAPRYAEGDEVVSLAERALACRQVMGRNLLAEALDTTGSAVWRFENGRIHPTEVKPLQDGLAAVEKRIAAGEFVKQERQPRTGATTRAQLEARIDAAITGLREAAADKRITKAAAVATALDRLDPPQPTA
jgi:hypothetical protein